MPRTDLDSYGLFDVESFKIGAVTCELGARGEWQTIAAENRNSLTYIPLSGSASTLWTSPTGIKSVWLHPLATRAADTGTVFQRRS